jgi:integrase
MSRQLRYQGPGLFDDEPVAEVPKPQAKSSTAVLVLDSLRELREQPKRRRRYQQGSLLLEPRKRSPDVWVYRYFDVDKVRRKETVGTIVEYPTRSDALRASEGLRLAANSENPTPNVTMRGLINRYMKEIMQPCLDVPLGGVLDPNARMGFACADSYRNYLTNYILPRWGDYPVRDFEKPEVQASVESWYRLLQRSAKNPRGLAPLSLRQLHVTMRQVGKFGQKWGHLKFNPMADKRIELPRGSTKRQKPPTQISPEQFLRLMSELYIREKLAVSFSGYLGTRVSETFGLQWQDIDLQSGTVNFKRGFTRTRISPLKTEASRTDFPIPEELVELLREWYSRTPYNRPTDWVFASAHTNGKRPLLPQWMMKSSIQPVARALGLPHIGWHTFRHSLSAWAKEAGLPPEHVKTLLRHQTLKMADVYGRIEVEKKREIQIELITHVKEQARKQSKPERQDASLFIVNK